MNIHTHMTHIYYMKKEIYSIERAYRKFNKAKDEHGPKAAKIRIRKVASKECKNKDGSYKVGDNVCRF